MYYSRSGWLQRRKEINRFVVSILLHLLILLLFNIPGAGIGKTEIPADFDLDAIRVENMIAMGKDLITTKTEGVKHTEMVKHGLAKNVSLPKADIKSVARQNTPKATFTPAQTPLQEIPTLAAQENVERSLEREINQAQMDITKETQLTVEKRFLKEEPVQSRFEQNTPLTKEFMTAQKFAPQKRQIKDIALSANSPKQTQSAMSEQVQSITRSQNSPQTASVIKPYLPQPKITEQNINKTINDRQLTLPASSQEKNTVELNKTFSENFQKASTYEEQVALNKPLTERDFKPEKRLIKKPALIAIKDSSATKESVEVNRDVFTEITKKQTDVKLSMDSQNPTFNPEIKNQPVQQKHDRQITTPTDSSLQEKNTVTKENVFIKDIQKASTYENKNVADKPLNSSDFKPEKKQIKNPSLLSKLYTSDIPTKNDARVSDATFAEVTKKSVDVPLNSPETKSITDFNPLLKNSPVKEIQRQERPIEIEKSNSKETFAPSKKPFEQSPQQNYMPPNTPMNSVKLAYNTKAPSIKNIAPKKTPTPSNLVTDKSIKIDATLPQNKTTSESLYKLTGTIEGDVKNAFLTINDTTQVITVINGKFEADVAMLKGNNKIELVVFTSRGGVGKGNFNILYKPLPGAPSVRLDQPENGRQGMQEGDELEVAGTVDDHTVQEVTLLLNGIPLPPMPVREGIFKRKIFLPNTRITTFRVMAKSRSGVVGYSSQHTVLSGFDIDLANPRPY